MATRSPPPNPGPTFSGDRATAPMALEEDSLSAWQRFEDLQKALDRDPEPLLPPMDLPGSTGPGYAPTEAMGLPGLPREVAAPAPRAAATLEEVMLLARRNNRACPQPEKWAAFQQVLPLSASINGRKLTPPLPVDGHAWAATSAMQKRLRLRDQLEWADRAGVLPAVSDFLASLSEEDWHHFGD